MSHFSEKTRISLFRLGSTDLSGKILARSWRYYPVIPRIQQKSAGFLKHSTGWSNFCGSLDTKSSHLGLFVRDWDASPGCNCNQTGAARCIITDKTSSRIFLKRVMQENTRMSHDWKISGTRLMFGGKNHGPASDFPLNQSNDHQNSC